MLESRRHGGTLLLHREGQSNQTLRSSPLIAVSLAEIGLATGCVSGGGMNVSTTLCSSGEYPNIFSLVLNLGVLVERNVSENQLSR